MENTQLMFGTQLGKRENRSRKEEVVAKLRLEREMTDRLFSQMGIEQKSGVGIFRSKSKL